MKLATYINDLLYRYDCVIVPDFGGFVTNKIGAKANNFTHTFTPPTKQVTFNSLLKHNDGLLANYIASAENISFEKASTAISLSVIKWQNELQSNTVQIDSLGVLSLNEEKQIIFEPNAAVNYLTESFGLDSVTSSAISRFKEQVKPLNPLPVKEERKRGIPAFIKYAATAAILLTLGYAGYNGYENNLQKENLANQEKAIQKKIQAATFVISNPLPTINLNVVKEVAKPFHIVAGAFQFAENAEKRVEELKAKGFDAKIIGVNKWGLTQVTFNSYASRNEATNNLYRIQKTVSKDAWLLVEKLD
ncbi:HU-CCDC81 and SPOR domain-containing protein [Polaribacter sp. R2A056_3_33]|jgi:diphthamide synthase (EF-2-diphthine--ammonia ligase)|uniref:HU domain-containing protein n=1 Tax=unclassified Polaribacter TaxID=196858 RepID=UPI001C4F4F8B|nr:MULTISPECIES: SPOR domain-containing protein [unclassified Polaribacter]QXP63410.1 HU-CCDC81 and SPOR domain-containing protein [Polaribacter sp. HaHaR_3_91]QXP71403.1 HU-CCDC81 and SPOR domain-containing protein [Polaribacter sp. R2A056_3_33]